MSGAAARWRDPAADPAESLRFQLSDFSGPVALRLSPSCRALLFDVLKGWRIEPWLGEGGSPDPLLSFEEAGGAYFVGGRGVAKPMKRGDFADAVCGFLAELVRIYVDESPTRLCLHAASAMFGDRLVVFPSTFRAGKSTLCAGLAAAGVRLAGDDVLLIDAADGSGEALGFPPRLRLPFPDNFAPASRSFVDRNVHVSGKQYRYLDLGPAALARKGERFPIRSFVLLDRKQEGPAALTPLRKADALQAVLYQNFARAVPPRGILECLTEIVETAETLRLGYSRAEDAVQLLAAHFAAPAPRPFAVRRRQDGYACPDAPAPAPAPSKPGQLRRRAGIVQQEVDAQTFLAVEESGRILSLNSTASALWRALEEPATDAELKALMALAFPEAPAATIAADVDATLRKLTEEGLITRF